MTDAGECLKWFEKSGYLISRILQIKRRSTEVESGGFVVIIKGLWLEVFSFRTLFEECNFEVSDHTKKSQKDASKHLGYLWNEKLFLA